MRMKIFLFTLMLVSSFVSMSEASKPNAAPAVDIHRSLRVIASFPTAETLLRSLRPYLDQQDYSYLLRTIPGKQADARGTPLAVRVKGDQFFIGSMKEGFTLSTHGEIQHRGQVFRLKTGQSMESQIAAFEKRLRGQLVVNPAVHIVLPRAFAQTGEGREDYTRSSYWAAMSLQFIAISNKEHGYRSTNAIGEAGLFRTVQKTKRSIESISCAHFGNPGRTDVPSIQINYAGGNYSKFTFAPGSKGQGKVTVSTGGTTLGQEQSEIGRDYETYEALVKFCERRPSEQNDMLFTLKAAQDAKFAELPALQNPLGLDARTDVDAGQR